MAVEHLTKQNHDLEEQLAKGMLGPIVKERSKRSPTSKGRTKKDQKAAMLRADKSDKIPTIHPSQKWQHRTWLQRYR